MSCRSANGAGGRQAARASRSSVAASTGGKSSHRGGSARTRWRRWRRARPPAGSRRPHAPAWDDRSTDASESLTQAGDVADQCPFGTRRRIVTPGGVEQAVNGDHGAGPDQSAQRIRRGTGPPPAPARPGLQPPAGPEPAASRTTVWAASLCGEWSHRQHRSLRSPYLDCASPAGVSSVVSLGTFSRDCLLTGTSGSTHRLRPTVSPLVSFVLVRRRSPRAVWPYLARGRLPRVSTWEPVEQNLESGAELERSATGPLSVGESSSGGRVALPWLPATASATAPPERGRSSSQTE